MADAGVKFDFKGGGQITPTESDSVNGLKLGTIQATVITTSMIENIVPALSVLALPYLFDTNEEYLDFILNSPAMDKVKAVIEKQFNCKVITFQFGGRMIMANNVRQINTPADLKGIKMRIPESPYFQRLYTLLGANPSAMNVPDTLVGLQQGTMDGANWPIVSLYNLGMYEFLKYVSVTEHSTYTHALFVRKDVFESMSSEQQQLMLDSGRKAATRGMELFLDYDKFIYEDIQKKGAIINFNPDKAAFRKALLPLYKESREKIGAEIFDETMKYLGIELD
jgi:TRAP-type C4-dicarboxylate transport system substrate-binding protein